MRSSLSRRPLVRVFSICLGVVAVMAAARFLLAQGNQPAHHPAAALTQTAAEAHADHVRYETELKKTMTGHVSIYFDVAELESKAPRMANMKFVDLVDVTGKHLLCFADPQGDRWLVDPDTVLTYRMHK